MYISTTHVKEDKNITMINNDRYKNTFALTRSLTLTIW